MPLTGRFWFKKTWSGKLILLVEEKKPRRFKRDVFTLPWREAKLLDLAEAPMQPLMDLGRIARPGAGSHRFSGLRIVEPPAGANLSAKSA
ncbi:hypothetical protein [Methylobacterium nigriterrae]|uniref:hypothetical protein n=1 Tax=Methylobacterium nigriterrae TaxID=3127512 RepID=UPI003014074C